jgi:hypothetical protein
MFASDSSESRCGVSLCRSIPLLQIVLDLGSANAFINEHDFMAKKSHLRVVDDLHDGANIYFSIPKSHYVNGTLQNFPPLREFTSRDFREFSSSNHFYSILPINVTSAFFARLTKCRLCARK